MWQVTGIYIAGSWLAFELVERIAESADQPWLPNVALVLLIIGFVVVLAAAYVQERPSQDVSQETVEASSAQTSAEPAAASAGLCTARNTIVALILVAAGVFTLISTGIWTIGGSESVDPVATPEVTSPEAASVVVLTLDNIGGREDIAYLSEGITEQITAQLAKVPELKVISRTSAETVMGYNLTIPEIADSLGVEHVVEGSVQLFGEQIRVTAQLIHAETDDHLWADSYDGQLQNLFAFQEDIAIQVASALTSAVGGVREISSSSRTEDPVAYEAYLIGKSQLHRRSVESMLAAIESFERSIAQDPNYAPGYAGLAMTYGLFLIYGHPELNGYELYGRAIGMANRAIELDQESGEAYAARGYVEHKVRGPAGPIEADFQRALELSPNSTDAHGWYAAFLVREGRYDEGFAESTKAIEIDPLAPARRVGTATDGITAGRYDIAIQEAQRALVLAPTLPLARFIQAIAYLLAGRLDDCIDVLGESFLGVRAMCQYSRGDADGAIQIVESLKTTVAQANEPQSHTEMLSYREIAMFYAWVGNVDEALDWLERAFAWSHNAVQFEVMNSGVFDRVSEDPDFQSSLERIRARIRERLLQAVAG